MTETSLPPLNWLRAFEAAARNLSFTGAARELHMTQSAVSQQIKSLENFLGKPLFLRRPRALELTDAAENYLPTVQEAFATLARQASLALAQCDDGALGGRSDGQRNRCGNPIWA